MLVLTRRIGEEIVITGGIRVRVVAVRGEQVRLGVDAPPNVRVDRQEIAQRREEFVGPSPLDEIEGSRPRLTGKRRARRFCRLLPSQPHSRR